MPLNPNIPPPKTGREREIEQRLAALERYVQTLGESFNALSRVVLEAQRTQGNDAPPEGRSGL